MLTLVASSKRRVIIPNDDVEKNEEKLSRHDNRSIASSENNFNGGEEGVWMCYDDYYQSQKLKCSYYSWTHHFKGFFAGVGLTVLLFQLVFITSTRDYSGESKLEKDIWSTEVVTMSGDVAGKSANVNTNSSEARLTDVLVEIQKLQQEQQQQQQREAESATIVADVMMEEIQKLRKELEGRMDVVTEVTKVASEVSKVATEVSKVCTTTQNHPKLPEVGKKQQHVRGDYLDGCTTLLSTFPNSGTSWTQTVFTSSLGMLSEAIYKEGPPSNLTGAYIHGHGGSLPNQSIGECRLVKSHARVSYKQMPSWYQRSVILYRDPHDNFEANLRYLSKLRPTTDKLKGVCNITSRADFLTWNDTNSILYSKLRDLHIVSHKRFYCHAQTYPIPKLFVTYSNLLQNPDQTFKDIMMFIGYPNANITKAMIEHPPHHNNGSSAAIIGDDHHYRPIPKDECEGLNNRFSMLWNDADECTQSIGQTLYVN